MPCGRTRTPLPEPGACTSRSPPSAACWTRSPRRSTAVSWPARVTRTGFGPDDVDLGRFERAIAAGRAAKARGAVAAAAFTQAIDLYTGELLPEEGPAEWVSEPRDHYRASAVEAAQGLAEEALLIGDHVTAVRACRFGLEIDRYQDAFWRMLILAREQAGDAGAASRDRRDYALVLEALGVEASGLVGPS
jgi:DNA-binding SARP family transcriptional activator